MALRTIVIDDTPQDRQGYREKTVTTTPTAVMGHGAGGLFAYPGLEREITNAMVLPTGGLIDLLPSRTADTDHPFYGILTGQTAASGSNRDNPCGDSPTPGLTKLCMHAFKWGLFSLDTRPINIRTLGRRRDRGDWLDFNVIGDPLMQASGSVPTIPGNFSANDALRDSVAKMLRELAVDWKRIFTPLIWTGNPTNNTAGGGYKEPYGLDYLINDGYVDAETNVACPAADSLVRDFGSLEINSNASDFVQEIVWICYMLKYNAEHMGLAPASWAIVMPFTMFYVATALWACEYYLTGCKTGIFSTSQTQMVDAEETTKLRDDMRRRRYLLIDGEEWPVVVDETTSVSQLAGGSLKSTIYWVPLRVQGGTPVTFLEYFNYDGPFGPIAGANALRTEPRPYTTNGGRYLWVPKTPTNGCIQSGVETEWRIILETPQIAARLDNVKWTPRMQQRDWRTTGSFHKDGGRTTRTDSSFYPPVPA